MHLEKTILSLKNYGLSKLLLILVVKQLCLDRGSGKMHTEKYA